MKKKKLLHYCHLSFPICVPYWPNDSRPSIHMTSGWIRISLHFHFCMTTNLPCSIDVPPFFVLKIFFITPEFVICPCHLRLFLVWWSFFWFSLFFFRSAVKVHRRMVTQILLMDGILIQIQLFIWVLAVISWSLICTSTRTFIITPKNAWLALAKGSETLRGCVRSDWPFSFQASFISLEPREGNSGQEGAYSRQWPWSACLQIIKRRDVRYDESLQESIYRESWWRKSNHAHERKREKTRKR